MKRSFAASRTVAAAAAIAVVASFACAPRAALGASAFSADKGHSEVSFVIRHMMSQVRGTFHDFSATIVKDDANPAASSVDFRIQAATVDTNNEMRDKDLRGENFFAVDKFPEITFKSTKIEKVSDGEYNVTGELTLRGVTKVLTLPVSFLGVMNGIDGKPRMGFSLTTKLDRKEFGIVWNKALDNGSFLLSDDVTIEISIEAKPSA